MQEGIIHVTGKPEPIGNNRYILEDFTVLNPDKARLGIKEGFLVQTDDFAFIVRAVEKTKTGGERLILTPY